MKKIIISLVIIIAVILAGIKGIEWWLEGTVQAKINENPDRLYDIIYHDLDLAGNFTGLSLDSVLIRPVHQEEGTIITGSASYAALKGLDLFDFLFHKTLIVKEITFADPRFEITVSEDTTQKTSGQGMQNLFKDVLSRAEVGSFQLQNGTIIIKDPVDDHRIGQLHGLNVLAENLETDSIQWENLVPFELGNFVMTMGELELEWDEFSTLKIGGLRYDDADAILHIDDISMVYNSDWLDVSRHLGVQLGLMEVELDELEIHFLDTYRSLYSDLDIHATRIVIDGLDLRNYRDKNFERPPDVQMPMFKGMVDALPIILEVDTIEILNSKISYTELGKDRSEPATISFSEVNGLVTGLSTISETQDEVEKYTMEIAARFMESADLKMKMEVDYDEEAFVLWTQVGGLSMPVLNPVTRAMAGIEIESGVLRGVNFQMYAGEYFAQSDLILDYTDLKMTVLDEKSETRRKMFFVSTLANMAVRTHNHPDLKNYRKALNYKTQRNIHRAPFQYIVQAMVEGMLEIFPGGVTKSLLGGNQQDTKKKKG